MLRPRQLLDSRFGGNALQLDDLIDKKQIRKQSAQVNRGVQIVDQLRTDGGLGEHQFDGSQRCVQSPSATP